MCSLSESLGPSIIKVISVSSWEHRPRFSPKAVISVTRRLRSRSLLAHQRQAAKLTKNRDDIRVLLGRHMLELAEVNLKLGSYKEAAVNVLEIPTIVPSNQRGEGCFDAARILARLVKQVGGDQKISPAERDQLTRTYLGRTVVLLRDAIDTNPSLSDSIKTDNDIKGLESNSEFQMMLKTLVNVPPLAK